MNNSPSHDRDYSIDNIRFLFIFFVVFAHLLEVCNPFTGSGYIYKFIYSFHMPIFIFMFGYHVRFSPKRVIYRWCFPYAIFQCFYLLFVRFVLNTDLEFQFTTPYWLLWYMLVCIYYQLLLPLYDTTDKRKQTLAILCAFIISLLIGYENSVGYYMSLSRFFVFQPWFLLGYYCKKSGILDRSSIYPRKRFCVLFISAAIILLLMPYLRIVPKGLLYGSMPYSTCGGTPMMRGIASIISFSVILFCFVGMKPYLNKKILLITTIGQNTWPIFLLHGFVVKTIPIYFPNLISSPWRVILFTCVLLLVIGNRFFSNLISYSTFSWLERLPSNVTHKEMIGKP